MTEPEIVTDVAAEPIAFAEAKAYLKVDEEIATEDALIARCLKAARIHCERYSGLAFAPRTLKVKTAFYTGPESLPYGPNQVVTEVLDKDGNIIPIDKIFGLSYEYLRGFTVQNSYVDEFGYNGIPKGIYAYGRHAVEDLLQDNYTITYTTGYAVGTLPEDIQLAILKMTAELYLNRENTIIGTNIAVIPLGIRALLDLVKPTVIFR